MLSVKENSRAPQRSRGRIARIGIAAVAVALGAGLMVGTTSATAQDVGGLRAKAAQIAAQLDALQERSSILDEQYLQTQHDLDELATKQQGIEASVAEAQSQMDTAKAQASSYVVAAFMGAGSGAETGLGGDDPNQGVNQKVLLDTVRGDRTQLTDDLDAAKKDLADRNAELEATKSELQAKKDSQAKIRSELESSVAQQSNLLDGANAELQAAIKAEQERKAAEAAAKAAAEAQQRAAAQAAAAAARAAATTTSTTGATATTARGAAPAPARAARPSAPATPPPAAPVAAGASGAVAAALSMQGVPYRWAGASPSGFDCSGLTMWAWARAGKSLPHSSGGQMSATQRISADQLQPGDLVFYGSPVHHVSMYIGGGQVVEALNSGSVVSTRAMGYAGRISGYGRVG